MNRHEFIITTLAILGILTLTLVAIFVNPDNTSQRLPHDCGSHLLRSKNAGHLKNLGGLRRSGGGGEISLKEFKRAKRAMEIRDE